MRISAKEVEHIAMLARLKLTDEEKELFSEQLSKILDYIEKLNELDTEQVEPTSHVIPLRNVFREDQPAQSLSVDDALKNAPDRTGSFYRVPKIIE